MKIFALAVLSLTVPAVCSAHSGTLVNAVASYLPFLAPIFAGGFAGVLKFLKQIFKKDADK